MKSRINSKLIAVAMAFAMVFTMMPMMGQRALAEDAQTETPAAISLGADVLAEGSNTGNAKTVYMAGIPWRVIGYGGVGVASSTNTMTLISNGNLNLGTGVKFRADREAEDANHYSKSNLIGEVNAVAADTFSDKERAGIVARTLESGTYEGKDTDCIAGDPINSAVLWPLSIKEAETMNKELRVVESAGSTQPADWTRYWWLRSPGGNVSMYAGAVKDTGDVCNLLAIGFPVDNKYGLRPAFNYNLKTVLLTSAATGGKASETIGADALAEVGTNESGEWKMTLKDTAHQNFDVPSEVSVSCTTEEIPIKYGGAATGENEYISAIIKSSDGKIKYYGRLASATNASGTVNIKVDGKLGESDTLYIFNEQVNADNKSDFSSPLREVKVRRIHDLHKTEEVEATCTEDGVEAYWTCDICNKLYEDERGETEIYSPVPIPAKGHSWDGGKVTKKATPTAEGVKTYTCTGCREKKTESIPKCAKYANPLKIKAKTATIKYKKLKKKKQTLAVSKVMSVSGAQGTVTYAKVKGNKKITINKTTGKVTVKKKLKKGKYKVQIKVTAAGTTAYNSGSKTVTVTIRVK